MNHDKEEELIQKLKAKKVWVALLQETWKPGHEPYENQGFTFIATGWEELIQKLKAKKVWVALLQETWKPGHESYENQGFTFHCNGLPSRTPGRRGTQGVAIGLGREATRAWQRHA